MFLQKPFLSFFALASILTGVISRRGHDSEGESGSSSSGSSGSSDSDSAESDSTSTSSSGSTYTCVDDHRLTVSDLEPDHYSNYTFIYGSPDAYTDWNGAYFQGEAFFNYDIRELSNTSAAFKTNCPTGSSSIRMLGVAWIGPKAPTPTNLRNPFSLGFKAWKTDKSVTDIAYSYSWCDQDVDLIHLGTTVDWRKYSSHSSGDTEGAIDAVVLNVTQDSNNSERAIFDGYWDLSSLESSQRVYSNDGRHEDQIHLPGEICQRSSDNLWVGWEKGIYINGSITNETLELSISGSTVSGFTKSLVDGSYEDEVKVNFSVTFTGSLDTVNSSQILNIGEGNSSLVNFERATGRASSMLCPNALLISTFVVIAMTMIFII
ncbi:hypothetical protein N7462_010924 [Penicillium macrosclerotiorum]|uniref:uncharacterized protein n=1 Tax=Penicillium macrosclerotiorum TaxID=303699 RepID=UPI002548EC2A|nr:uncharacterized protein N7462_010924 [Penicillium macrosclerotiorum]KAJ5669854.1 hypothetical protein N7462_010924 [Penicillium macrosclerotiorum]